MSKFLLLLGVSGVGKSTIIDCLQQRDARFVYISPYTTRPLRPGERNKVSITGIEMDAMADRGEFLAVNELFGGIRYATPRQPILDAMASGSFPVLDWPVHQMAVMRNAFPNQLFVVYVAPPSLEAAQQRLGKDGRDVDGKRFASARAELEAFWAQRFVELYDCAVVAEDDNRHKAVDEIYGRYLSSYQGD